MADGVDASLTESGLLARHTANIARLASSFGIQLDEGSKAPEGQPGVEKGTRIDQVLAEKNDELDGLFDQSQFEKKLQSMVPESQAKSKPLEVSPTLPGRQLNSLKRD